MAFNMFIMALLIGSFLNVVIYRLPRNESVIYPPSHCPSCGTRLQAIDLVPLLSFIWNKGRCKYCGVRISWQYPLVELLTGVLFLAFYQKYGLNTYYFIYLFLLSLLIAASGIDCQHKIIPNKITYPGIILGLILSLVSKHITWLESVQGIIIPGGLLLLIALIYRKGMGMGDVKLVAMIGSFIGWEYTLAGIFIGSFLGSLVGLLLIISGVIERKTRIPFGPFISGGVIIALLWGEQLFDYYLQLFY